MQAGGPDLRDAFLDDYEQALSLSDRQAPHGCAVLTAVWLIVKAHETRPPSFGHASIVDGGQVHAGMFGKGRYLGPLEGAHAAERGDAPPAGKRGGGYDGPEGGMLGVAGLVPPLSRKSKASAFLMFPDGAVHQRNWTGTWREWPFHGEGTGPFRHVSALARCRC